MSVSSLSQITNASEVQIQLALSSQDFARAKQFASEQQLSIEKYLQRIIMHDLAQEENVQRRERRHAMQDLQHAMAQEAECEWSREELLELERIHNEVRYEQSEAALAHQPECLANLKAYNEEHKDRLTFRHLPAIFIESGIARGDMLETLMDIWREVNAPELRLHISQVGIS